MVEALEILNSKGYEVIDSYLASYDEQTIINEKCPKEDYPKAEFMNWLKENDLKYLSEDEEFYHYETKILARKSYIKLADSVKLEKAPINWELDDETNSIRFISNYYYDEKKKKSLNEFKADNEKYLDELIIWANDLPPMKGKKMKNTKKAVNDAELGRLINALEDADEKALRYQAELQNFKKRKEEETAYFLRYANEDMAISLLPIIDNFERAINMDDNDLSDEVSKFLDGFKMIYGSFIELLNKYEIKEIQANGLEFDPNYHQAVLTESDQSKPAGVVLEVLQKGYLYKDKVIRPAMVKVNE